MHIAAEVIITAGDYDIERAAERAKTLSLIISHAATPTVIAADVNEDRSRLAAENNVVVMHMPQ